MIIVNITDPDANRDPDIADSVRDIRVYSESDIVGEEFSAIETGVNTGVFRLAFKTSLQSQDNGILVKEYSDEAKVEYTDEFPADFTTTTTEKIFTLVIPLLHGDPIVPFRTLVPEIITSGTPAAGKQTTLLFVVINDADYPQPFVGLVEVRDHNSVTVFLAWQSGTLDPNSQTQIGVSWTPDRPGDYEIRTFLISDLESPNILSFVETTDIIIADAS